MNADTHTSTTARLVRRAYFSAAHRYYSPDLSEQENIKTFGKCYTPYGHGHDYLLEAYLDGPIDPTTGMVMNLADVDRILKSVTESLDHKHLNFDIDAFQTEIPTTENIAKYCFNAIQNQLTDPSVTLHKVRLYESSDLWVDYGSSEAGA